MEIIKLEANQVLARKNDIVKNWFLVQDGMITQKFDFSEITLGKNAIIGMLEKEIYECDYIVSEDAVLAAFPCNNAEEIKKILAGQEKIRDIFLNAAIKQRHQLLGLYSDLFNKAIQFHTFVESQYNDYKMSCYQYKIAEKSFSRIEHFNPLTMHHRAEKWEIFNSISLVKSYMQEYIQLMGKDDSLTVGVIMEAAAQMRRFALGISEIEYYLTYNKDVIFSEAGSDLFELFFELAIEMHNKKYDISEMVNKAKEMADFAQKLNLYNPRMLQRRLSNFVDYDYADEGNKNIRISRVEMDITTMDSIAHILEYAGYSDDEADEITRVIYEYRDLPDVQSTDSRVYSLRRELTSYFYGIYYKVFMRAMADEESLTPVLEMFLNFGFMDVSFVGEQYARELYDLCAHLDICQADNVFTIYQWLKCIYKGEKEPSKNEFDLDFGAYLTEQYKNAKITKEQVKEFYTNREMRVRFEIENMFMTINKLTYGKITTFCPILREEDIISSIDRMLVTAEKLETAMNEVRKLDFSAFYREVPFSDPEHGINADRVMKEVLPDIILMPNAGSRGMMWQEISTKKRDTPGRFMFPILTIVDMDDLMLEAIGRFRWEMCRRMEGVHWNDIREKSLTAEYVNYLMFYRKNHELSNDAKDKIKSSLMREKNNFREVFVKDYINWIRFESKGSFRLNKVTRDILVRYCPFAKSVRNELKDNPLYQVSLTKFDNLNTKNLQRYQGLYSKYERAGGIKLTELKETIMYYDM